MSVTILYRSPARPNEGSMTMLMGQENAEATIDQLEERGFVVEKITYAPSSRETGDCVA
jgi:hypothetical protein